MNRIENPHWWRRGVILCTMALLLPWAAAYAETKQDNPVPPADRSASRDAQSQEGQEKELPPARDTKPLIGPALESPRELLDLFEQRRRALDRREESVRAAEDRLGKVRAELERLVERTEKAREAADHASAESRKQNLTQLAKMYETMPSEEAAARIEKMPTKSAIELLHQLKGKTAGAILSQVRPDIAARLTERYLSIPVKNTNPQP